MNILEQYKKAVKERGGSSSLYDVATGTIQIGEEFEFPGASWQRVGEKVSLHHGWTSAPIYGYARIVRIDAYGFKTARRIS